MINNKANSIISTNSQRVIKPVSNLSAQSDRLCRLPVGSLAALEASTYFITKGSPYRLAERVMADLMLSGGLRVSEALGQRELKVNALGQIFIFGTKGSDSKLVTPIFFKEFWKNYIGVNTSPFIHVSRFSFYKLIKANNIFVKHGPGLNNSVTHAFRHLHVQLMQAMDIAPSALSEAIGHKGKSSLNYYLYGK